MKHKGRDRVVAVRGGLWQSERLRKNLGGQIFGPRLHLTRRDAVPGPLQGIGQRNHGVDRVGVLSGDEL